MELEPYFFDTYALFEVIRGSPEYVGYQKGISIVTTRLNLMELYYGLLRDHGKKVAEHYFDKLWTYAVDLDEHITKDAMEFRLANRDLEMSYIDCMGYIFAVRNKIKFLTGDKAFKDLEGVEYVK